MKKALTRPWVQTLEANKKGRDLIVGDIHGMFNLLEEYLVQINFDPAVDRLFCSGDLTDRGPNSIEAINWLNKDWFYCCIGNHDANLISIAADSSVLFQIDVNYIAWLTDCSEEQIQELLNLLWKMPVGIEIIGDKRIGITHASVHRDWDEFKSHVVNCNTLEDIDQELLLWNRGHAHAAMKIKHVLHPMLDMDEIDQIHENLYVSNIDYVFHGHSIDNFEFYPYNAGNRYYIDGGAYYYENMELLEHNFGPDYKPRNIFGFYIFDINEPEKPLICPNNKQ